MIVLMVASYIFLNWCVSWDPKLSTPRMRNCGSAECLVTGRSLLFGVCLCACGVWVGLAVKCGEPVCFFLCACVSVRSYVFLCMYLSLCVCVCM